MKLTSLSYLLTILLGTMSYSDALSAPALDCSEKVPSDLQVLLKKKYPDFRVPHLSDLDKQSIDFDLSDNGDGCFAVAKGKFGDNFKQDIAILLVPISDTAPYLVVAMPRDRTWKIDRLPSFCQNIQFCYVKIKKPGTYTRSEALTTPSVRKNERDVLSTKNEVVFSGHLESTGIAYVYEKGVWLYVWVED